MPRNKIGIEMDLQHRRHNLLIKELGVCKKTAYNWIKNETQPSIFHLKRIAELLGVSMEELVEL